MSAETLSDIFGLASGIVLLLTAFRNDGLGAFIVELRKSIEGAKKSKEGADQLAEFVASSLDKDLTTWSTFDRYALHIGAALLALSFGFKVGPTAFVALGWMTKAPCGC